LIFIKIKEKKKKIQIIVSSFKLNAINKKTERKKYF